MLGLPHASVVIGVDPADGGVTVTQELGAGVVHELRLALPAVVGVQVARQAPRYVPVARVRQAMEEGRLEEAQAPAVEAPTGIRVRRLFAPEVASQAEMLSGDADAVAGRIAEIIRDRGIVKR
jgi:electron transfer flavoprotein beta subunit